MYDNGTKASFPVYLWCRVKPVSVGRANWALGWHRSGSLDERRMTGIGRLTWSRLSTIRRSRIFSTRQFALHATVSSSAVTPVRLEFRIGLASSTFHSIRILFPYITLLPNPIITHPFPPLLILTQQPPTSFAITMARSQTPYVTPHILHKNYAQAFDHEQLGTCMSYPLLFSYLVQID